LENHGSDDNLGSCGSVDDAQTPDDDTESLNQSMSSPGGLSGLSSLQSPSTSLASPINLLASPSTPNPIMSHHHDEHQMVASLVNQLQRNKANSGWDGKHQNHQKSNGMSMLHEEIKKEQQKQLQQQQQQQLANDVQIKTEPMDQSNNHLQQHHRLDPFFYDKLHPIIQHHRNPVGANPRDVNNPLSVNQLTRRDFQPNMGGGGGGYYSPFQKPMMTHPLAHPHHPLAQFHAANFANFQLAAAAAAAQQTPGGGKDAGPSNGTHHRDDGNAISVT
jgi:transcription factor 7-like 2